MIRSTSSRVHGRGIVVAVADAGADAVGAVFSFLVPAIFVILGSPQYCAVFAIFVVSLMAKTWNLETGTWNLELGTWNHRIFCSSSYLNFK